MKSLAAALVALVTAACTRAPARQALGLDQAAESYARLVLALAQRDPDSLDSYRGPPAWLAAARARRATLADIGRDARLLAGTLESESIPSSSEAGTRRRFLVRQLRAVVARAEMLRGTRLSFADESSALFALEIPPPDSFLPPSRLEELRAALDRWLPGTGDIRARYLSFDRAFLVPTGRLQTVFERAVQGCRQVTLAHIELPRSERVDVEYVGDSAWSAFARYDGAFRSRIQVNTGLPLTIDRVLDLACHEAYPGHHTIGTLLERRFPGRIEFSVQFPFSPQSLLHEAAASVAGRLAFPDQTRVEFERQELFPLAGLGAGDVERYVRVNRLVDELSGVQLEIARRYIDGSLDFPRAARELEREALMPSADATLKFLNQYRSFAATYTIGREMLWREIAGGPSEPATGATWRAYEAIVSAAAQELNLQSTNRQFTR